MKTPDSRIFDDLARMAGGAMNVASALREQITQDIKARVEEMAAHMDLVPREDFDRLALQVAELQKRVDALGEKAPAAAARAVPKKPAVKKTAAKKSGKNQERKSHEPPCRRS